MYPLLACSIIALTVVIERSIFWIKEGARRDHRLVDHVLELCQQGNWEAVRKKVKESKDFIIRVLVAGILHREFSMSKAMEAAASEEIKRMRRYMSVLDTMITVAPLLGIFGTVIGIINAFQGIGQAGSASLAVVAPGIAEALIATAVGLFAAIPATVFYNHFVGELRRITAAIDLFSGEFEGDLRRLIGASEKPARAARG